MFTDLLVQTIFHLPSAELLDLPNSINRFRRFPPLLIDSQSISDGCKATADTERTFFGVAKIVKIR
jgi:hypothetical protein